MHNCTSALLVQKKNFGFFKIYGVSARTREWGSADKGGSMFRNFVWSSFIDGPLPR